MRIGAGLGLGGHLVGWNVGRVGDDHVDQTVQEVEGRWVRCVAAFQVHAARADTVAVMAGQGERIRFLFDGPHFGARGLGGNGQRDRPGAGAQVDDARLAAATHDGARLVNGQARQDLCLRAHDEHARHCGQDQRAEKHASRDVLEGNTQGSLCYAAAQLLRLFGVEDGG